MLSDRPEPADDAGTNHRHIAIVALDCLEALNRFLRIPFMARARLLGGVASGAVCGGKQASATRRRIRPRRLLAWGIAAVPAASRGRRAHGDPGALKRHPQPNGKATIDTAVAQECAVHGGAASSLNRHAS